MPGRVDPLRHMTIQEVRLQRGSPLRVIRESIAYAITEAAQPRSGGRRHMREPLTQEERDFHNKVTARLVKTRC